MYCTGRYDDAIAPLEASVKTTEEIYGSSSIELAHDLQKLTEVLFNAKRWQRLKIVVSRAKKLFILNYGLQHEAVRQLMEMQAIVVQMDD